MLCGRPRTLRYTDTDKPEQLVPIRLEFDVEHHKMRDTFVWNLNDPIVTPENFAQTVVEDYNLSANYHAVIVKSINDQLSDFKAHSGLYDGDGAELSSPILGIVGVGLKPGENTLKQGTLDEENEKWWAEWRKRLSVVEQGAGRKMKGRKTKKRKIAVKEEDGAEGDVEDGFGMDVEDDKSMAWDKPLSMEEIDVNDQMMHEEMRILIRLDIIVGSMKLDDQFEWDLDNEDASPESFAEVYTQELGLNGEFRTAIAHSIREQVQTYQKSLFLVGHPSDGSAVQDEDLRSAFLPSLNSATRPADQVPSFTPLLNYLSDGEIERNEKERDKDMNRRRKRNTRGRRGIALPDREPIRTYRTPAIGFPELDAATLALAAAASAPMSRRAAAAAASVTIANMVASENGTAFMPQMPSTTMAPQPPPMAVKEKKTAKGHFKAPPLPQSVLKSRAHVATPTVSTAADVSKLPPPLENDPPPAPPPMSSAPSGNASASDSRAVKVITAKRAKELEREAKEKEFADGQHANFIDGVWHCSNCGCPENIAIGRRKGPLGDKSQCGTCGKFWHRHRRPRPVEYNTDPDFHNGIKRDAEVAKTTAAAKKRGGAAALRAQSATVPPTPAETSGAQTPSRSNGDMEMSSRLSPGPSAGLEDDRAISPVSTASSASEPPLAQRLKMNGLNSHTRTATPAPVSAAPAPSTPVAPVTPTATSNSAVRAEQASGRAAAPASAPAGSNAAGSAPTSPTRLWPPQWLTSAKEAMKVKYPSDKFEIILRKVNATSAPEWRIKCSDCPGKLYTPGPGETLSNYEVHLKNRQHRQRVNDRLNGTSDS
ncbi:SNF5-domain-containing protein [Tricholoma matsutake]|nr:SNF5-domain-containing protein [Tricholoma matsutake 945]